MVRAVQGHAAIVAPAVGGTELRSAAGLHEYFGVGGASGWLRNASTEAAATQAELRYRDWNAAVHARKGQLSVFAFKAHGADVLVNIAAGIAVVNASKEHLRRRSRSWRILVRIRGQK